MTEPQTLEELCAYIEQHAGSIYVREQVRGSWGDHSLLELEPRLAIHHALRIVRERLARQSADRRAEALAQMMRDIQEAEARDHIIYSCQDGTCGSCEYCLGR